MAIPASNPAKPSRRLTRPCCLPAAYDPRYSASCPRRLASTPSLASALPLQRLEQHGGLSPLRIKRRWLHRARLRRARRSRVSSQRPPAATCPFSWAPLPTPIRLIFHVRAASHSKTMAVDRTPEGIMCGAQDRLKISAVADDGTRRRPTMEEAHERGKKAKRGKRRLRLLCWTKEPDPTQC